MQDKAFSKFVKNKDIQNTWYTVGGWSIGHDQPNLWGFTEASVPTPVSSNLDIRKSRIVYGEHEQMFLSQFHPAHHSDALSLRFRALMAMTGHGRDVGKEISPTLDIILPGKDGPFAVLVKYKGIKTYQKELLESMEKEVDLDQAQKVTSIDKYNAGTRGFILKNPILTPHSNELTLYSDAPVPTLKIEQARHHIREWREAQMQGYLDQHTSENSFRPVTYGGGGGRPPKGGLASKMYIDSFGVPRLNDKSPLMPVQDPDLIHDRFSHIQPTKRGMANFNMEITRMPNGIDIDELMDAHYLGKMDIDGINEELSDKTGELKWTGIAMESYIPKYGNGKILWGGGLKNVENITNKLQGMIDPRSLESGNIVFNSKESVDYIEMIKKQVTEILENSKSEKHDFVARFNPNFQRITRDQQNTGKKNKDVDPEERPSEFKPYPKEKTDVGHRNVAGYQPNSQSSAAYKATPEQVAFATKWFAVDKYENNGPIWKHYLVPNPTDQSKHMTSPASTAVFSGIELAVADQGDRKRDALKRIEEDLYNDAMSAIINQAGHPAVLEFKRMYEALYGDKKEKKSEKPITTEDYIAQHKRAVIAVKGAVKSFVTSVAQANIVGEGTRRDKNGNNVSMQDKNADGSEFGNTIPNDNMKLGDMISKNAKRVVRSGVRGAAGQVGVGAQGDIRDVIKNTVSLRNKLKIEGNPIIRKQLLEKIAEGLGEEAHLISKMIDDSMKGYINARHTEKDARTKAESDVQSALEKMGVKIKTADVDGEDVEELQPRVAAKKIGTQLQGQPPAPQQKQQYEPEADSTVTWTNKKTNFWKMIKENPVQAQAEIIKPENKDLLDVLIKQADLWQGKLHPTLVALIKAGVQAHNVNYER